MKSKKQRIEPIGSKESLYTEIRRLHAFRKKIPPVVNEYQYEILTKQAQVDFETLGKFLTGAPDLNFIHTETRKLKEGQAIRKPKYPPKLHEKPTYLSNTKPSVPTELITWNFVNACIRQKLPLSSATRSWYKQALLKNSDLPLQRHWLLEAHYKRPDRLTFDTDTATEIIWARRAYQPPIVNVVLEFPGNLAPVNANVLDDHRPIPTTAEGHKISIVFTKLYLQRRIVDWIALGGHYDQWIRYNYWLAAHQQGLPKQTIDWLLNPFYFDLWKNLSHFRTEYERTVQAQLSIRRLAHRRSARKVLEHLRLVNRLYLLSLKDRDEDSLSLPSNLEAYEDTYEIYDRWISAVQTAYAQSSL